MARRLELLGAELAGFRGGDDSTHTRVRPAGSRSRRRSFRWCPSPAGTPRAAG